MVRVVDHNNRKNKVLAFTVSSYIKSGQPVSSALLAGNFGLSSATMRNILAELEEEGYLFHPHTSAGKVPSSKGYRYYVDFLMSEPELSQEKQSSIINEYQQAISTLEGLIEKTSDIIAHLTHYASLVSFSAFGDKIFYKGLSNIIQQPEFHDPEKLSLLINFLEERKRLFEIINQDTKESLKVYIGEEIGCPLGESCSLVVSTYKGKEKSGRLAVLGPRRMSYGQAVSALDFISRTLSKILDNF